MLLRRMPMVVDQVCYQTAVAVDNELIGSQDTVRSASYDRPLGLPGPVHYCSGFRGERGASSRSC